MSHRKTSLTTKTLMVSGTLLTIIGGIGTFAAPIGFHLVNLSFMAWFCIMGIGAFLAFAWIVRDCQEQGITFKPAEMRLYPPED